MDILFVGNVRASGAALDECVATLHAGDYLAVPTECGYRLAFRADRPPSAELSRRLGWTRPGSSMLLAAAEAATRHAHIGALEAPLLEFFWPGPLVLVAGSLPPEAPHGRKIALRCPNHPLTLEILRRCPFPVRSHSLRDSYGHLFTQPADLLERLPALTQMKGRILRANAPCLKMTATVVDVASGATRVLRPGFITAFDLSMFLPGPILLSEDSPGHGRRDEISAQVNLIVVEGESGRVARRLKNLLESFVDPPVVLVSDESSDFLAGETGDVRRLGPRDGKDYLHNLQRAWNDIRTRSAGLTVLAEGVPRVGVGAEYMEILARQARHVINTEDPGYFGRGSG